MSRVLLLFIDGIGIGIDDPGRNPFAVVRSPFLPLYQQNPAPDIPHHGLLIPTAADLDYPGLPQSATGQTAIFCGINSADALQRHVAGLPTPTLRKLIDKHSLFIDLKQRGLRATFANALTEEYFEKLKERISATTRAQRAGGYAPRMLEDLRQRQAVSHDMTNAFLRRMGYDVPLFSIEESAHILAGISAEVDFCLFEFVLSDSVGHKGDLDMAVAIANKLHRFLDALLPAIDLNSTTVLLTSDHGNLEDVSVTTHTTNPVPTLVWGAGRERCRTSIRTIMDIKTTILSLIPGGLA